MNSRPATSRCSTASGRIGWTVVRASPIGTEADVADVCRRSCRPRRRPRDGRCPGRIFGRGGCARLVRHAPFLPSAGPASGGEGWTAEQDLEVVAREVRLAHDHPLQGLRQDQVPLVRSDPHEQLVAPAVDVHLVARDERQSHREHVARSRACARGSDRRDTARRWPRDRRRPRRPSPAAAARPPSPGRTGAPRGSAPARTTPAPWRDARPGCPSTSRSRGRSPPRG